MKHAIFIPSYLLTAFTTENYVQHQIIRSNTLEDLSAIHLQLEAFHSADQRSVNLSHSLHILKEFHRLQNAQIWMRLVTLLLSSSVLSLCLGCISWLEYRDQRYLIALLRSFGIPPLFLAAHQFISDLLLVLLSMTAVIFLWPSLSSFLMKNSEFAFTNTYLPPFEVLAIYLSGILGVSLANIPVWRALKKPIGEVLQ